MLSELPTILSLFGGYVITSAVFFKYPHILHKRKHIAFVARNISHRGGAAEGYENTIGTFQKVVDMGTDMLEVDCQITKDGKVVVAHDDNLKRLSGVNQNISTSCYDELPLLQKAIPIDFEPGKCYQNEMLETADRKIPLLEDVFKTFNSIPINIDIKRDDTVLIEQVASLITQYNREKYCVWGNVKAGITEKCYKMNPEVNLLCSRRRVLVILFYYYTGLLPFVPLKETHLEIFLPSIYLKRPYRWRSKIIVRSVVKILDLLLIRKSLFTHLKKRGMQVYLWVLNEENEFERAFRLGATGVMTDYPSKLSRFIDMNKDLIYSQESDQPLQTNTM